MHKLMLIMRIIECIALSFIKDSYQAWNRMKPRRYLQNLHCHLHQGQKLNLVCVEPKCPCKGLICHECKHSDGPNIHEPHLKKVVPLKNLLQSLEHYLHCDQQPAQLALQEDKCLKVLEESRDEMLLRLQRTVEDMARMVQLLEQKVVDQYELKKTLILDKLRISRQFETLIERCIMHDIRKEQKFEIISEMRTMVDYIVPRAVEEKEGHHKFQLELRNQSIMTDYLAQKESMAMTCAKLDKYMQKTLGNEIKKQDFEQGLKQFREKMMEDESSEDQSEIRRRKKEEKRKKKEQKEKEEKEKQRRRKKIFEGTAKMTEKQSMMKSSLMSEIKAKTSGLIKEKIFQYLPSQSQVVEVPSPVSKSQVVEPEKKPKPINLFDDSDEDMNILDGLSEKPSDDKGVVDPFKWNHEIEKSFSKKVVKKEEKPKNKGLFDDADEDISVIKKKPKEEKHKKKNLFDDQDDTFVKKKGKEKKHKKSLFGDSEEESMSVVSHHKKKKKKEKGSSSSQSEQEVKKKKKDPNSPVFSEELKSPMLKLQSGGKGLRQTVTSQNGWAMVSQPLQFCNKISIRIVKLKAVIAVGIAKGSVMKDQMFSLSFKKPFDGLYAINSDGQVLSPEPVLEEQPKLTFDREDVISLHAMADRLIVSKVGGKKGQAKPQNYVLLTGQNKSMNDMHFCVFLGGKDDAVRIVQ